MGAGEPNWARLHEMGKLPKDARDKVPSLMQIDALEDRMEEIRKDVCDDCRERVFGKNKNISATVAQISCEAPGCTFIATGKIKLVASNVLRKHMTEVHPKKKEEEKDN